MAEFDIIQSAGSFLKNVVNYADDFLSGEIENAPGGNLNNFISQVKKRGFGRSSHFMVTINTPPALFTEQRRAALSKDGASSSDLYDYHEMLALFCKGAQLPGLTFATNQIRTFGEFTELPYEKLYDNVQLTLYLDANLQVKKFFDNWMDSIQLYSTKGFAFYEEYTTTITIDVFSLDHTSKGTPVKVYSVKLNEAYPKAMGAISLDYDNPNIMTLDINIQYKNWVSASFETTKSGVQTVFDRLFGDNPIYTGVMGAYSWIGSVLTTADTYLDRFDRIKGGLSNMKNTVKTVPGLIKNKVDRIKHLNKF